MKEHRLRNTHGPKTDEDTRDWRRQYRQELYELYCSPKIMRILKCSKMRRVTHVTSMEETINIYSILWGNLNERLIWETQVLMANMKRVLKEKGYGQASGCCAQGCEHCCSIKCGKFLHQLRKYYLLKNDSARWSWLGSSSVTYLCVL